MNDRMKLKEKIVNKLESHTFQQSESKFLKLDVMSTNSILTESRCEPFKSSSLVVTNHAAHASVETPDVKESGLDILGETSNFPTCSTEMCRTDKFDITVEKKNKRIGTFKIGKRLFSWNKVAIKRNRKLGHSFTCSSDVR